MDTEQQFLTAKRVAELTTFSRATINRKVDAGEFPAPVFISERRKVFSAQAVRRWMAERMGEAA